jgi:uncharacterized peroxidase-related enzyme
MRVMGLFSGTEPDDVVKTALYRPAFFGKPWVRLVRSIMRGPSAWTPGERELFGAFVSRLNTCPYCTTVHTAGADLTLGSPVTSEGLDRWRDGGFGPAVSAALALLEKMTLSPEALGPRDIAAVRAAGVGDDAILDAICVGFLFNVVNRLANALGYRWPSDDAATKTAAILNRTGYYMPGFLLG